MTFGARREREEHRRSSMTLGPSVGEPPGVASSPEGFFLPRPFHSGFEETISVGIPELLFGDITTADGQVSYLLQMASTALLSSWFSPFATR